MANNLKSRLNSVVLGGVSALLVALLGIEKSWGLPSGVFDLPELVAVQNRQYYLNHGLTVQAGTLPSDAFNKSITAGIAYSYYLTDYLGWEILNLNYAHNIETSLKKDLLTNFKLEVQNVGFKGVLDYITYYATTGIIYTPFYNKSLLSNRIVVPGETSFILSAGVVNFDTVGLLPLFSLGLVQRYFVSKSQSMGLDLRQLLYLEESKGARFNTSIMLNYSFQLGSSPAQGSEPAGGGGTSR